MNWYEVTRADGSLSYVPATSKAEPSNDNACSVQGGLNG